MIFTIILKPTVIKRQFSCDFVNIQSTFRAVSDGTAVHIQFSGSLICTNSINTAAVKIHRTHGNIAAAVEIQYISHAFSGFCMPYGKISQVYIFTISKAKNRRIPRLCHYLCICRTVTATANHQIIHTTDC